MIRATAFAVGILVLSLSAHAAAAKEDLGAKVLAFAEKHKGEQVGNGECATLAGEALKDAGAKRRGKDEPNSGDYTWGEHFLTVTAEGSGQKFDGKKTDIHPGDIIQFRDTKFAGKSAKGHYTQSAAHHTAIVLAIEDGGSTVRVLHQNFGGKKIVQETTLHLGDLKEGWLRFYHPTAAAK